MDPATVAYEALPKAALYAVALLSIGVVVTRGILGRASNEPWPADLGHQLESHLARVAVILAVAALVALAARAWAHTAAAFGAAEALRWENVRLIALESRWGGAWRRQLLAAFALVAASLMARRWPRGGWVAYGVAAAALCSTIPLLGHASGSSWRVTVHAIHLLAGGAWLGTLTAILLLSVRPASPPIEPSRPPRASPEQIASPLIARFSNLALAGVVIVVITGVVSSVLYLGILANLWSTAYGRMLLVKTGSFLAVAVCGFFNFQRARSGQPPRMRLIAAEVALAGVVVSATSVLTELEHP